MAESSKNRFVFLRPICVCVRLSHTLAQDFPSSFFFPFLKGKCEKNFSLSPPGREKNRTISFQLFDFSLTFHIHSQTYPQTAPKRHIKLLPPPLPTMNNILRKVPAKWRTRWWSLKQSPPPPEGFMGPIPEKMRRTSMEF